MDEKYSIEWKNEQQKKHGGWAQKHLRNGETNYWYWHYLQYGTEYRLPDWHGTKKECERENGKTN